MFYIRAEQQDGHSGGFIALRNGAFVEVWDGSEMVFRTAEDAVMWARATASRMESLERAGKSRIRSCIMSLSVRGPIGVVDSYLIGSRVRNLH